MTTPSEWHAQGRYFDFSGQRVFYRLHRHSAGDSGGRALICIHGYPTASWDWHAIWGGLCARFDTVLAPDMLGFGYSAKPRGHDYRIFEQCDLHEELARQLGIREAVILAHDYGDTVAQEWLARAREGSAEVRPLAIAFLNGGLFPETHRARRVQKLLASPVGPLIAQLMQRTRFDETFRGIFGSRTPPDAATLDAFWSLATRDGGKAAMARLIHYMTERRRNRERWVGALADSPVPLRVIDGVDDPVSGGHMVARYRELVPGADAVELPGVGHYPQVEAPEEVLAHFLDWAEAAAQRKAA